MSEAPSGIPARSGDRRRGPRTGNRKTRRARMVRQYGFLPIAGVLLLSLFLHARLDSFRAEPASQNPSSQTPASEAFVGTNTCRACHPAFYTWFSRTAHFATIGDPRFPPPLKGCEMCHGPGREHVRAGGRGHIFNPRKASAREVVAMCTSCHQEKRFGTCGFHENQHRVEAVSCNDCHNPHQEVTHKYILREEEPSLCYQCHREIRAEFLRPFHHKVPEGGMSCRQCHEQHTLWNTTQSANVLGGRDALCLRCHTDKEGPFVFEHISLKSDRCLSCHVPHGSANPRLLTRRTILSLCLECHGDRQGASGDSPQGFHDLTDPRYQNCTSCHVMIHGSNTSRLFFR